MAGFEAVNAQKREAYSRPYYKEHLMAIAIQTSKQAIQIERRACAELVLRLASEEDEGEVSTALKNAAMAVLRRIPGQFDGE